VPGLWKHRSSTTVFENPRVRVLEDVVVQPDGTEGSYTVVEERAGAVLIVAVDEEQRVVLVRQHRYPIDASLWEVPGGEVPVGVDPLVQARQELREETGIIAGQVEFLGSFAPWPARLRRCSAVALATELDVSRLSNFGQGSDESIEEVRPYSRSELLEMIASGDLLDANTLCSLALYWAASRS
jgi:8-oxo-dGTP pyrophosphatase MutT (NUDIX family)